MAANEAPGFWFEKPGIQSWLLAPFSWMYSRAATLNMQSKPSGWVDVPVLCIGNFIAGGGGKTPTAMALAEKVAARGFKPGFLSRGYGGRLSGPIVVDHATNTAGDVGDEPLLLARKAVTVISSDRLTGAQLLVQEGCDFIIMDDGFQNPKLGKDYCLVVVDSRRGVGNGFAIPAGPLRVSLSEQLLLCDSLLVVGGESGADKVIRTTARSGKPIHLAEMKFSNPGELKGKWMIAFAGIADPEKFFASLRKVGADLAQVYVYGDHHHFNEDDIDQMINQAKLMKATLVTTSKDFVRLLGMGKKQQELAKNVKVANATLVFEDARTAEQIIDVTLQRFEKRQLRDEAKKD